MSDLDRAAMQDALSHLTPTQTATMLSFMQACEPACFEAALAYVIRPVAS
ncbi:hypothetical protein Ssi03_74580 [Sphaerisporangium siamense]|uniref:DNA-binding protein YbaB n=1 Tax=Sphaerisporangium siamense TaxID=795645 RepID=A0A7W7GB11_9ACTN|nr:hypothetical protein [Sphaerisporangium siamense]MBB4702310.1 DNA-binding protein YbaB [Sphaerisporangium siamense]GII89468.1 hypothetical protein Ssi03_74580 [Sphaerisporangium siamense]